MTFQKKRRQAGLFCDGFLLPFCPLDLENRMTVCMGYPAMTPKWESRKNAAGRGQEIHAERTAIRLMWTFCLHEVKRTFIYSLRQEKSM